MNKIKNIIIVNDFDYTQGGASKVAIDTANILVNSDKNLNIYYFSACHSNSTNLDKKVINICTNQGEALKDKNKIRGFFNGLYNFKAKKQLKELLLTLNKEETIVHVHGWTKALSSSVFDIAFKLKYKVVLTMHDYFTACPNGGYYNFKTNSVCNYNPMSIKCLCCNCDSRNYIFKIYRFLRERKYKKSFNNLKNVISISNSSLNILKQYLPNNISIYKINNPIDFNITYNKIDNSIKKKEYYLYVGRLSPEKGVNMFCKALSELKLPAIVVGDGPLKEQLKDNYPEIDFVGWKSKEEVNSYMKNAKCLVMPSKWYEPFGLTAIESIANGTCAIVSANSAVSEYISRKNKNGLVFFDFEDLKNKILDFEKEPIICRNNLIKLFSPDIYLNKILDTYNSILNSQKGSFNYEQ